MGGLLMFIIVLTTLICLVQISGQILFQIFQSYNFCEATLGPSDKHSESSYSVTGLEGDPSPLGPPTFCSFLPSYVQRPWGEP
jgi:hypothetical protein